MASTKVNTKEVTKTVTETVSDGFTLTVSAREMALIKKLALILDNATASTRARIGELIGCDAYQVSDAAYELTNSVSVWELKDQGQTYVDGRGSVSITW